MTMIVVGNQKGGVAKTRIATGIAALAASNGVEVVLLDTDVQGSAMSWSRIRNEENVSPSIPTFSLPQNPTKELASMSNKYDLIVVDIGANNYRTMLDCALLADLVIVPCGPDQQEIESTLMVFETFASMGPRHVKGSIPAKVLMTRMSTNRNSKSIPQMREVFEGTDPSNPSHVPVFKAYVPHRAAWLATGKTGRALHELKSADRSDAATLEMQALYDEIIASINQ